jgi:hypothetical protein
MLDIVVNWIGQNQVAAWISSLVLSMSAVGVLVNKYGPKIRKISKITAHVLDLVNGILDAADDKVITKEEVELILALVKNLEEELK